MSDIENELTKNERLEFAQDIRRAIIDKFVSGGEIPDDLDKVDRILKTLKDSDSSEISVMRLKAGDKSADANNRLAHMLEQLAEKAEREGLTGVKETPRAKNALDDDFLTAPNVLPGELSPVGHNVENSQGFFERMESENPDLKNGGNEED